MICNSILTGSFLLASICVTPVWGDQAATPDWRAADAAGFLALGDRLIASSGELRLSEAQARSLAQRHVALLDTRTKDTAADYLALMKAWGGTPRIDETSMEFREAQVVDWHAPGSPCSWERVDAASLVASTMVFAPGEPLMKGWPRLEKGAGPGTLAHGSYTFAGGTESLVTSGAPVVQIITRVATVDGSEMTFGIRWVWNATEQAWLPWHVNQVAQSPGGVCALFY